MTESAVDPQDSLIRHSYEAYEEIMRQFNQIGPQRQGFTEAEFVDVLHGSDVISTDVEIDGDRRRLPQLSPVERYSWLNADWYGRHFPEETASGTLLHFTELPGIEPGERVQESIRDLAARNGTLVFDFPSGDPEYPERVQAMLDNLGVRGAEPEILGTQTYFAGRVHLKRDRERREEPLDMARTFELAIEDGSYDMSRFYGGASIRTAISEDEARYMGRFYDKAFQEINDSSPCWQGLSTEEFMDMAIEREHVVKVVNSAEGQVAAIVLLDNHLDELSWLNTEYYQRQFPEDTATGNVMYFPGLAADPDSRAGMNTQAMVNLMAELAEKGDNEFVVAFDCCDRNTAFLPDFLEFMINATPQAGIDIEPIADHKYMAIKLAA